MRPPEALAVGGADAFQDHDRAIIPRIVRINSEKNGDCSGVIYARNLVLTAAHCLWDPRRNRALRPEAVKVFVSRGLGEPFYPHAASRIIAHPDYKHHRDPKFGEIDAYDLAIIVLQPSDVLALPRVRVFEGREKFVSDFFFFAKIFEKVVFGFGPCDNPGRLGKIRMRGYVESMASSSIWHMKVFPVAYDSSKNRVICPGDSGGGVFVGLGSISGPDGFSDQDQALDLERSPMLLGIVATGKGEHKAHCAQCSPSVQYTRLDIFRPWIETYIRD